MSNVDARDRVPHFGSLLLQVFLLLKVRFSSCESGTCTLPSFPQLNNGNGAGMPGTQYVIPTMNISGCGVVTEWAVVAAAAGANGNKNRQLQLQLFRPDTASSNVFSPVHSTVVSTGANINSGKGAPTITPTFTLSGFTFSPGDVLGFYIPSSGNLLRVRHTSSFDTHSVLTSNNSPDTANAITLSGSPLTSVPLISVAISCMECLTTVFIASTSQVVDRSSAKSSSSVTATSSTATPSSMTTPSSTVTLSIRSTFVTIPASSAYTSSFIKNAQTSMAFSSPASIISRDSMVVSTNTFTGSMDGTSLTKESRKSSEYSPEPSMIIRSSGGKDVRKLTLVENIALVMTLLVILLVIALVIVVIVVVVKRNKVKNVFHFTRSFSKSIIGNDKNFSVVNLEMNSMGSTSALLASHVKQGGQLPATAEDNSSSTCTFPRISTAEQGVSTTTEVQDEHDYEVLEDEDYKSDDDTHCDESTPYPEYGLVPTMDQRQTQFCADRQNAEPYTYAPAPSSFQERPTSGQLSEDDHEFQEPGTEKNEIYAQMAKGGYREIPHSKITLSEKLGEGQFGEVYEAKMTTPRGTALKVAVKLVKTGSPEEENTKLLQEAYIQGQFKHRHIVELIGVVTVVEPTMMLMELLTGGDLSEYLHSLSENPSELSSPDLPSLLFQFCKQVVDGLACLARKSFVHRDIAARNILLDKDLNCKISDFGMTRDLEDEPYYVVGGARRIPLKWTAPEALMYKKYSTSSDVWSYGMLMYEIWSVGHKPYEKLAIEEVIACFHNNFCHPPPPGCPRAVYEVMVKCWNPSHNERPSASDIGGEFCKSERILLSWKKEDIVSPSAQVLGGPLLDGADLYKELQFSYSEQK